MFNIFIKRSNKIFKYALANINRSSSSSTQYADIVIAGGGMVGTSLACALGQLECLQGRRILLLEATPPPIEKEWKNSTFENRVSAITPGSKSYLEDIGVWQEIENRRFNPFADMKVWDSYSSISLNAKDGGVNHMAYMVENSVIVESCTQVASLLKPVKIEYSTRIKDVHNSGGNKRDGGYHEEPITVVLANGKNIQTHLLVGADGFNSFVRQKNDMETYDYDYKQSAVVATLHIDTSNNMGNTTAWQRYLTTGPVALLPISNSVSSLVWSTDREKARYLLGLSDEEFVEEVNNAYTGYHQHDFIVDSLQNATNSILSILKPGSVALRDVQLPPKVVDVEAGSRAAFPLILKHANEYVRSRVALIGDAAHRIHPMAGQGVNLGFGDALSLSNTIQESVLQGKDFGALENLLPFETDRQRRVIPIISAINGLNTLFSSTFSPIVFARSVGMNATDTLPILKERIVRYAMG